LTNQIVIAKGQFLANLHNPCSSKAATMPWRERCGFGVPAGEGLAPRLLHAFNSPMLGEIP